MNDDREQDDIRRAEQALEALRPAQAPDPAFRARLRREFAAGTIAPPGPVEAPAGGASPARPAVVPLPRPRRAWPLAWGGAFAAAAAVLVVCALVFNHGPAWRVARVAGAREIVVDGRSVHADDAAALAAALVGGASVHVPEGGTLELVAGHDLAIQMAGGTDATLPHVPGRWFAREVAGSLTAGEWRITTGGSFPGARLQVVTPHAHVEVTGTTLAVICQPQGTCVCVFEGHVKVGRTAADMATVQTGRRRYVYADTIHVPLDDAMLPPEVPALGGFCETMRPLLRRPR